MKQDSRSPEQNRSLYTHPPPPSQIKSPESIFIKPLFAKILILKLILFDSIHRHHSFKSWLFYYTHWRILPFMYGGA